MRKAVVLALAGLVVAASACAPKIVPSPVATAPKFPEFTPPAVPAALAGSQSAANFDRGWRFLQAGDFRAAEREFSLALQASPAFYPAEGGLAYLDLARRDPKNALPRFDRALELQPSEPSLLIGRGDALVALERMPEAIAAFDAALAADPSLTDLRRRVEVMKFKDQQRELAGARLAARSGKLDEAIAGYQAAIARSPDSPFLYRELAAVERRKGDADRALEHFRKAVALDPADASSLVQIGELLEARGDGEGAMTAYNSSLTLEPNPAIRARVESVRARLALASLPEEYRAIDGRPQITREDLAALIGIRLAPVLQRMHARDAVLITDVRNSWAETWIMAVARVGVIEPFANHAFQPQAVVHRSDVAQALTRLLPAVAPPAQIRTWEAARVKFADLASSHLAYPAASLAVASGLMTAFADGSFQPAGAVSGMEAIEAIDRLTRMTSLPAPPGDGAR
jgi:tetratricopeptide (TPR) repeat protein